MRVRHLAPDDEAQLVGPVQPSRILGLLVLAHPVQAERLRHLDVVLDGVIARRCQDALGPVALVERELQEIGSPLSRTLPSWTPTLRCPK